MSGVLMSESHTLHHGDALDAMRGMPDASVDAVVTDPPYGLAFMGKSWDACGEGAAFAAWAKTWAVECLRVLKPGGHLVAFGGTRMWHRLASGIEDAGFEIRDSLCWLFGSGFPKSLDVSKAIDKAAGAVREVVGHHDLARRNKPEVLAQRGDDGLARMAGKGRINTQEEAARITAPATAAARQWDGWGTALKPAHEPIVLARKPLPGTVAATVLEHGTGALNIDGCRVAHDGSGRWGAGVRPGGFGDIGAASGSGEPNGAFNASGRWPANVVLDEVAAELLDAQTGDRPVSGAARSGRPATAVHSDRGATTIGRGTVGNGALHNDAGGASRFFYVAKASSSDRELEDGSRSTHPTVKPVSLMRWLVRLVTPPGGLVLDPFTGSGSTGVACIEEGFRFVGIEREAEYVEIARARMDAASRQGRLDL